MSQAIMLQGTAAGVGKSLLAAALCYLLAQNGSRVAPFKAQDMVSHPWATSDGGAISPIQACQAEAAGVEPQGIMNPVLLEPAGAAFSRIIFLGQHMATLQEQEYHWNFNSQALPVIGASIEKLQGDFDFLVLEGAGSPAEINLRSRDIVNMRVAQLAQAPVLLVTDIDRGGAFASLIGTLELLTPRERALVQGFVINKFRGDMGLLQPALDFLEERTGLPVLGVIPYLENHWLPGTPAESGPKAHKAPHLPPGNLRKETYPWLARQVEANLNLELLRQILGA